MLCWSIVLVYYREISWTEEVSCSRACLEKMLFTHISAASLFKWQMSLNYRAILLSLCSFLIFFHFRPNVFFVVARLTSDKCNPPLLVCVCFSVCVEALRWTDYREICRMLYASLEHMAMWDNVCDNGVFLLQNTQTCTHMARHQTRTSCLKKKWHWKKRFLANEFQRLCQTHRRRFIAIAWQISNWRESI